MTETETKHPQYLRRISFVDGMPDKPGEQPVAVPSKLFLDGVDHSEVLAYDRGFVMAHEWQIIGQPEVIVSFVALAAQVTTKLFDDRHEPGVQVLSGTHIAGIPVLTPANRPWEAVPPDVYGQELVRVWIFAQRVEVLASNQLPDGWEIKRMERYDGKLLESQ